MFKNYFYKQIFSVILLISIFFSVGIISISAEEKSYDYLIEGEAFSSCNFTTSAGNIVQGKSIYSQKQYLNLYSQPSSDVEYYAEYSVNVEREGTYIIDIASTPLTPGWSSPIYVSVNGGDFVILSGNKTANIADDTQIAWYKTNSVNLSEGTNTIRFSVKDRVASNNRYVCFIDCFTLTKGDFSLSKIKTMDAPFGVFQDNQQISLTLEASGIAIKDTGFAYEIIDYKGSTVRAGRGKILSGSSFADINISALPKGHYSIIASSNQSSVVGYFSVVTRLEDRTKYSDTPFALDAMPYGIYTNVSKSFVNDYIDLLELSGVTWVRDRCYFNSVDYSGDKYNISLPAVNTYGSELMKRGIRISNTFNSMAKNVGKLTLDYSKVIPTDIVEMYKYWKDLAEQYDGKVTVWEPLNEFDLGGGGSNYDSPDLYSSVFKAMAIGVSDAKKEYPVYLTSEPASSRSGPYYSNKFIEMMFENDLFDYADIDNYHSHRNAQEPYDVYYSTDNDHTMKSLAEGYAKIFEDYETEPLLWNTESGIYLSVPSNEDLDSLQQTVQAKYLVTSSIEAISYGSDKYFYFCGPNYQEGMRAWGMTSRDKSNPSAYASWPALSALTHVLGEGEYLGKIKNLEPGISAYAFQDGERTAIVFWAEKNETVGKSFVINTDYNSADYYDFFANHKVLSSEGGSFNLVVSDFPSYIKFDGSLNEDLIINDRNIKIKKLGEQKQYSPAQRIIITQKYNDEIRTGVRMGGYNFIEKENEAVIEVTNLNDKTMSGTITASADSGWKVTPSAQEVVIGPMDTVSLKFNIIPDGFASLDAKVTFRGLFDGEYTSKSVAYGKSRNVVSAEPIISEGKKYINVALENTSDIERIVKSIEFKANDYNDTFDEAIVLQPNTATSIKLPTEFSDNEHNLNLEMRAYFMDGAICTYSKSIQFAAIPNQIDMTSEPTITLPQDGEIVSAMLYGDDDLSAKLWLAADKDNFYLTARVTDNYFSNPYIESNIWQGDGMQFTIGKGLPSTGTKYAEIGIADTPSGAQAYCWTNQLNGKTGLLEGATKKITHDGYITTYEVAIPWTEIPLVSYDDDIMSFSFLLNENDGAGRVGYIEWGSGIGSKKEPDKFRTILFIK